MKIFTEAWVTPDASGSTPKRTGGVCFELPGWNAVAFTPATAS
jgi:hypothetical protein